jgi:hypothetical protein
MPNQNDDIVAIYNSLCDQQDALSEVIQITTDPDLANAISTEITEITHRIILAQNLLFKPDSSKLAAAVAGIKQASDNLTTAIQDIQNATAFIKSVSSYLALIDKAIDLAKTLAAVA